MDMLHPHQVEFLQDWQAAGGVAFLLAEIAVGSAAAATYLLPFPVLHGYWLRYSGGGRARISAEEFAGLPLVRAGRGVALDWLATLERETEVG